MKILKHSQINKEIKFIGRICEKAVNKVINEFTRYTKKQLVLSKKKWQLIDNEYKELLSDFVENLLLSEKLSFDALNDRRSNKKRIFYNNPIVQKYRQDITDVFPTAANIWILNGLVIKNQIAGIKYLAGLNSYDGAVIDVLGSASSLNLGAENPWLIKADRFEDYLGVKDNVCTAYHPGIRQAYALRKFTKYDPVKRGVKNLKIHSESSGTIVNSIAIESSIAYAEKILKKNSLKILAVDGTWAGGYGTAREGTGFGVDAQQLKKAGKTLWVDRCLPAPNKSNYHSFLKILKSKVNKSEAAGLYIEPDVIGDLGIINTDPQVLKEAVKILSKYNLPIIADCVQQIGRSGSYWGENVDSILKDYKFLILTTAKSASNGQPFSYIIMPKEVSNSAYPLSQLTTNQMNGPLFRALTVAEILSNKEFQAWLSQKSKDIEIVAKKYGFSVGDHGLRGKFLNRAIYVGNNDNVKLVQLSLLIEDGIIVGALPDSIRYQPMLLETSQTNKRVAEVILKRVQKVLKGDVSKDVVAVYNKMVDIKTGLARSN